MGQNMQIYHSLRRKLLADNMEEPESLDTSFVKTFKVEPMSANFCFVFRFC